MDWLGTGSIDCLLCDYSSVPTLNSSIGVSNHNLDQLRSLISSAEIKPAVNQVHSPGL